MVGNGGTLLCVPLFESLDNAETFTKPLKRATILRLVDADDLPKLCSLVPDEADSIGLGVRIDRLSDHQGKAQVVVNKQLTIVQFSQLVSDTLGESGNAGAN